MSVDLHEVDRGALAAQGDPADRALGRAFSRRPGPHGVLRFRRNGAQRTCMVAQERIVEPGIKIGVCQSLVCRERNHILGIDGSERSSSARRSIRLSILLQA